MARWSEEAKTSFLERHLKRGKRADQARSVVFPLLESQRWAMAMYTSCGWFFDDVSGLEPTQNMKYAARAIELAGAWFGHRPAGDPPLPPPFRQEQLPRVGRRGRHLPQGGRTGPGSLPRGGRLQPPSRDAPSGERDARVSCAMQRLEDLEEDPSLDGLPVDVRDGKRRYARVEAGTGRPSSRTPSIGAPASSTSCSGARKGSISWDGSFPSRPTPLRRRPIASPSSSPRRGDFDEVAVAIEKIYGTRSMRLCDVTYELRMAVARKRLGRVRKELGSRFMLAMAEYRPLVSSLQEMKLPIDGSLARLCELGLKHPPRAVGGVARRHRGARRHLP